MTHKIGPDIKETEDLRVLLNLIQVDLVLSAHFLKNLNKVDAESLLKKVNNKELSQIYNFMVQ